jgi:hypothetical protein
MPIVILDPGLLAFLPGISRANLLEQVKLLASWSKFCGTRKWAVLCLVPSVTEFLARNNLLPAYEPAQRLLAVTGLGNVYSAEDLVRPVYHLLERALPSAYCCIVDELHESFNAHPEKPWHGQDPTVESLSEQALIMSHIENQLHGDGRFRFFASTLKTDTVSFSAQVDAVVPETHAGFTSADLPKTIKDQFQHVRSIEDISASLDPREIWADASSLADIKLAIQLGCRRRMISEGTYENLASIPTFFVGSRFLASLEGWQADGHNRFASTTLECCVAAVLDLPLIEIKEFRKAKRSADLALPLRAHISERGVALRLMMWQRPGAIRCIEFANVGGKDEEEILYSAPSDAV